MCTYIRLVFRFDHLQCEKHSLVPRLLPGSEASQNSGAKPGRSGHVRGSQGRHAGGGPYDP